MKISNGSMDTKQSSLSLNYSKIIPIILMILLITLPVMASDALSQSINVKMIMKNSTVEEVINEFSKQTGYEFSYDTEILNKKVSAVTIDAKSENVETVLKQIFAGTNIDFKIVNNRIFLKSINEAIAKSNLVKGEKAEQQGKTITGTVVDNAGDAIIGATIIVQGDASRGTVTDIDGNFTLSNVPNNAIIEVSYVGMKTQIINTAGNTSFNVIMMDDVEMLEELVVVGYGVQKKVNLTGAVASISSRDIQDKPVANTTTLLQGKIPGLVLTQNGAQAGNDNPELRIRGIGTFGNNNPMVIIDGVEGNISQIADIPAVDIENVSVLKDAASASIYGVRAANGVILITTKRGDSSNRVKVSYSGNYTLQKPGITPNYIDSYNWALMRNEVKPGTFSDDALSKLKDGSDPDHYANTNWIDAVLRNADMHQHHLAVSGGNDKTHYMTSVAYSNQDGIMKQTSVERISFRSNVDSRLDRFTFGLNVSGNKNNITAPAVAPSGEGGIMRFVSWFTRPTVPIMYSNGHFGYVDGSMDNAEDIKNPVELMSLGYRLNDTWRFNGNAFAGIDITKSLTFRSSFAYAFHMNATKSYSPKSPARFDAEGNIKKIAGQTNQSTDYWYRNGTWTNENILNYNKVFSKHTIGVLAGHSLIGSRYYSTTASIQGFPTENIYELNGGTINPNARGNSEEYRLQSFFGRINYDFDNKYLFEFNLRHDGSSRMPKAHRYATFPSVSAGWVFTNESFLNTQNILSLGKVRLSWGKLGNQEIGNYAYSATLGASGNYYFDQSSDKQAGMVQTSVPNENIKWETTTSINAGLDLGFLKNKIQTSFDFFVKETNDILMRLSMPGIFLGSLSAPYQNVGSVRNRGWEWSLNYNDGKGDWTWNAGVNLFGVKNEILEMGGLEETISGSTINRLKNPIGAFFGYKAVGIYRTENDLKRTNSEGNIIKQNGVEPKLGDIMFDDLNDDGNITAEDRQIIGNPFPKLTYSFNIGASWKNFDVSTFWQGVSGIYRYNWETTTDIRGNFTDRWLDRYSSDNINSSMPILGNSINDTYSSFWLENSSYLRLKNLELGYTFRQQGLARIGVSQVRVYFTGTNLLTFTPLTNWDPEKSSGDSRNDIHPNMKTYSVGINIQF